VLSAGAPSDDRWPQFEQRFDVKLVEWFGMVDSPGNLINLEGRVGSMGKPMSGVTFSVLGDDGQEVGPGVVGELVFAHDKGRLTWYHNKPELTEQAYAGGWFHSGDLAETDIDGFFYYRGRKKESMRRRGENISSWEVETCVNRHPSVVESAAFGVPSDIGEDEVMVVIVPQPDVTIHPEEIIAWCSEHLAYFAVPRYVEFIDNLPKTDTQRVQYGVLKQRGRAENTWDREAFGVTVVRR
jgi:crotonobetaine/carnitine-CoA ligase